MATFRSAQRLVTFALFLALPATATAQGQPSAPVSPKLPPGLTFSAGFSPAFGTTTSRGGTELNRGPLLSGSVEVAMNRFMVIQGEVFSWRERSHRTSTGRPITGASGIGYTGDWTFDGRQRNVAFAGNFLGRFGTGRFYGNAGVGFGLVKEHQTNVSRNVGCVPHFQGACNLPTLNWDGWTESFMMQFLAGLDVVLTPRLTAFANLRAAGWQGGVTPVTAGVRWTVRRAPVGPAWTGSANPSAAVDAIGKAVHVEAFDRSRQNGTLVSLTATHVTIRNLAGAITLPLSEVRGIRRQTRAILKGTLIGVAAGVAAGAVLCAAEGGCDGEGSWVYMMTMGIGAGAGGGIGAIVNLTTADSRIVYVSPARSAFSLSPILGKKRAGVGARFTW